MIRIYCKNTGTSEEFMEGLTLSEILPHFLPGKEGEILAAKVNNVSEGLKFKVFTSKEVEFLDYSTYLGRRVYCSSLCFLLCKAAEDAVPGIKIMIRRPISKGYFCSVEMPDGRAVNSADLESITSRMNSIVEKNIPFLRKDVPSNEAIELFRSMGSEDKVRLLESTGDIFTVYYTLGDTPDFYCSPILPSAGYLKVWELSLYRGGLLLRVPDRHAPQNLAPFEEQPKTFEVFSENLKWNSIMDLRNVGDVNRACLSGKASDMIQISEALQEKKIVKIAEEIDRRYREDDVRLVLITGPSSSGKSTFCKKLSVQLKACGLHPMSFSTDDYFVNRVETPLLPDGSYDFDNFDTVDHDYLQTDLVDILSGKEVSVPTYNFVTGLREFNGKKLKMDKGNIILVEGIHALNPALTDKIDEKKKFRIFINTITSISLDDHNCIPTSDNRLLRRIVRDARVGSFSPLETIANWPNVRRSEVKWIYPFQEKADVLFNSAYLVEFAVLRSHAERILSLVPKNRPEYSEAHRLLSFLHYFVPVSDKEIPTTSMIRSFIGS